jgi:hypothetical protein
MAVVVEQTVPFSSSTLDLENASRWNTLFPLIRPTVKSIQTSKGQTILVDTAHADSKFVHIVAFGTSGNLSSKLLDDKHVTAIVTGTSGAGVLTAADLPHTLEKAGIQVPQGVVVVRAGKKRDIQNHAPGVIEIETSGELEQNHVLQLLGTAKDGIRTNPHEVAEMLKNFVNNASSAHSTFHVEKAEGNPAVLHAEGAAGFEKAKHAVERDLKHVMKNLNVNGEDEVVYSVHFSDVNGLSRLENYIIAGEIAQFLGEVVMLSFSNRKLTIACQTLRTSNIPSLTPRSSIIQRLPVVSRYPFVRSCHTSSPPHQNPRNTLQSVLQAPTLRPSPNLSPRHNPK